MITAKPPSAAPKVRRNGTTVVGWEMVGGLKGGNAGV